MAASRQHADMENRIRASLLTRMIAHRSFSSEAVLCVAEVELLDTVEDLLQQAAGVAAKPANTMQPIAMKSSNQTNICRNTFLSAFIGLSSILLLVDFIT